MLRVSGIKGGRRHERWRMPGRCDTGRPNSTPTDAGIGLTRLSVSWKWKGCAPCTLVHCGRVKIAGPATQLLIRRWWWWWRRTAERYRSGDRMMHHPGGVTSGRGVSVLRSHRSSPAHGSLRETQHKGPAARPFVLFRPRCKEWWDSDAIAAPAQRDGQTSPP